MSKFGMLLAAGAGYVLGTRAGRGQYEKISERSGQLWQDPRVQKYVGQAKGLAGDKAREATSAAKSKVSSDDAPHAPEAGPSSPDDMGNDTLGTAGTGPQGNLP